MSLPRRALLLCAPAIAAAPARPKFARLKPGQPSALTFNPLPQERVALHAEGLDGSIVLPAPRARLVAILSLTDRDAAMLAFAADTADRRTDLFALVLWTDSGLRIGALDALGMRAAGGAHLTTRLSAHVDGTGLRLERDAAAPRGSLAWRRESWTDYLAWNADGVLIDRPPRPSPPETWQHAFTAWRRQVIAELDRGCTDVSGALADLCQPPVLHAN